MGDRLIEACHSCFTSLEERFSGGSQTQPLTPAVIRVPFTDDCTAGLEVGGESDDETRGDSHRLGEILLCSRDAFAQNGQDRHVLGPNRFCLDGAREGFFPAGAQHT